MNEAPRRIRVEPGPPFGIGSTRIRPIGRIGGLVGRFAPEGAEALRSALGPGGRVLLRDPSRPGGEEALADFDACFEGKRPVSRPDEWNDLLGSGRWRELRGAFAAARVDEAGGLELVRDAIGERSLWWCRLPEGLVFASALMPLLRSGLVPRAIDPEGLAAYLSLAYLPETTTLVRGVHELPAGMRLRFRDGEVETDRWWLLPGEPVDGSAVGEEEGRASLRERLETALRRRLPPSGEPIGATLSGGVDSSLVVALARKLHPAPLRTFSITFGDGYANELPWSDLVAKHCSTEHTVVELTPAAILAHLDEAIGALSDPIGDPLTVPNALVFREASREVAVVLNGEGGDPCFGGPKNLPMVLAELYGHAPDGGERARERSWIRAHQKCWDDLPELLAPELLMVVEEERLERRIVPWLDDDRRRGLVARLQALNLGWKGAHHILPKVDAVSFPFGALPRSPLFDLDVVELAFAMPPTLKLRGSVEKWILKRAVADLLPASILERPKSGMLVPVEGWFSGPLLPEAKARLLDGLAPLGIVRRDWIERLLAGKLRDPRPRRGAKIWLLLTLESWLRGAGIRGG